MSEFLDQSWDESHFTSVYDNIYGTGWWGGQQFTTGADVKNISSISLYMKRGSAVTGNFTVSLYIASGGLPTGSAIATSTKSYTEISTSNGWHNFSFGEAISVSPNTTYCLVWKAEASSSPGFSVCVQNNSGGGYTGGVYIYSTNQGSSYNTAGYDAIFKTYYTDTDSEIIDSYPESNYFMNFEIGGLPTNLTKIAQSFTVANYYELEKVKFYLRKYGLPTGNAVAKIYAHSGTYGTSSVPTGAALATSDVFDVSTLTGTLTLKTLTFSGENKILLEPGQYVVSIEYESGISYYTIGVGVDATSPSHSGNLSSYYNPTSSWSADSLQDMIFYVYGIEQVETFEVTVGSKARVEVTDNEIETTSKTRIERVYSTATQSNARIEVIQSKTTTSKSRIQVSDEKTINAKGRVNVLYEKSLEALSRVKQGYSKTTTILARVNKISEKNITSKSRIQNVYLDTISALANIFQETTKTITAKARVETGSVIKTISALSRTLTSSIKTLSSKASIQVTTNRTITAKSRVKDTFSNTLQSLSRVRIINISTINAKARLNLIQQQTTTIKARIEKLFEKALQAKARINFIQEASVTAKSSIAIPHTYKVTSRASITYTPGDYFLLNEDGTYTLQESGFKIILDGYDYSEQTISAKARIRAAANEKIISAQVCIFNTITSGMTVKARIAGTETIYPLSCKARIRQMNNENEATAKARVRSPETTCLLSAKARVLKESNLYKIRSRARITKVTSRFIRSKSRIKNTLVKSILAKVRINRLYEYYVSSKAKIKQIYSGVISALTRVKKVNTEQTISAKARIFLSYEKNVTTQACIKNTINKTISAKARIWIEGKGEVIYLNEEKKLAYNNDRVITNDESKNMSQDDIIIMSKDQLDSDNLI